MTRLGNIAGQSARALLANKGRAALTILGIVIGIASVIALLGIGQGAANTVTQRIADLGSTILTVTPGGGMSESFDNPSEGAQAGGAAGGMPFGGQAASTLSKDDLARLQDAARHPSIKAAAGLVSASTVLEVKGEKERLALTGVDPVYFRIYELEAARGRLLNADDGEEKRLVLGSQIADALYGQSDPIGQHIEIEGQRFEVIGVLAQAEESAFRNPNDQLYIPTGAAMALFGIEHYSSFVVQATSDDRVSQAEDELEATLLDSHGIDNPRLADFAVLSPQDLLAVTGQVAGTLTALLTGIAAISLLVGGIGIMNIMLVSVTERTREIGLRKAVGAKTQDILFQFLIEAVILTLAGSVLGILVGHGLANLAGTVLGFQAAITPGAVFLALAVAGVVGLVFGLYPAAKAARLNPIDALRYS